MRGIAPLPLGTKTFSSNHSQSFFGARNAISRLEEVMRTFMDEAPVIFEEMSAFVARLDNTDSSNTASQATEIENADSIANQQQAMEHTTPTIVEESPITPRPC